MIDDCGRRVEGRGHCAEERDSVPHFVYLTAVEIAVEIVSSTSPPAKSRLIASSTAVSRSASSYVASSSRARAQTCDSAAPSIATSKPNMSPAAASEAVSLISVYVFQPSLVVKT